MQGADAGPFTGTLLSGGIEDLIQKSRTVLFAVPQDVTRDFYKVGVELTLVPLREDSLHFVVGKLEKPSHQVIDLSDKLHIPVLDTVVHHLYKVTCSAASDPIAAGNSINVGGNALQDRFYLLPCFN